MQCAGPLTGKDEQHRAGHGHQGSGARERRLAIDGHQRHAQEKQADTPDHGGRSGAQAPRQMDQPDRHDGARRQLPHAGRQREEGPWRGDVGPGQGQREGRDGDPAQHPPDP